MSHADLIARLEALTGPSVWLDCDIHAALVAQIPKGFVRGSSSGSYLMAHASRGRTWSEKVPAYTASLDAAVALVERLKHLHGRKIICTFNAGAQIMGNDADYDPRSLPDNSQTAGWMAHVAFYKPGSSETYGPDGYTHAATPAIALLIATLKALDHSNDR